MGQSATLHAWTWPLGGPMFLGVHEHEDSLGEPTRHFLAVDAPEGLRLSWEHAVGGEGEDAGMTCSSAASPETRAVGHTRRCSSRLTTSARTQAERRDARLEPP